jgi:predicted tellurium resistance membrane protein TerC
LIVSIPIVVFGSQIIMRLITRFPILVLAGGGLLGYIAGEMMVEDPAVAPWIAANASQVAALAPGAGFALVVALGWGLTRRHQRAPKT